MKGASLLDSSRTLFPVESASWCLLIQQGNWQVFQQEVRFFFSYIIRNISIETYTLPYVNQIDNGKLAAWHRKLKAMFGDSLEGWDGVGGWGGAGGWGHMHLC